MTERDSYPRDLVGYGRRRPNAAAPTRLPQGAGIII
jgi:hypothetical protein